MTLSELLAGSVWLAVALLLGLADLLHRGRRLRVSALVPDETERGSDAIAERTDGMPGRGDSPRPFAVSGGRALSEPTVNHGFRGQSCPDRDGARPPVTTRSVHD